MHTGLFLADWSVVPELRVGDVVDGVGADVDIQGGLAT